MEELIIRPARKEDSAEILRFVQELADYEHAAEEVTATISDIEQSLFGRDATAKALIAELAGNAVGFAVYFFNYSTWQGRNGLYLEDLYVSPVCRGMGVGKAILKRLAQIAVEEGCGRFEWSVLDWNEPSIRVYESIGAEPQSEWIRYRLTGENLRRLAES